MSLVPSLLQAIVKVDGEAMVMHAGDKPYVVSPTGQVELASRGLTLEAVNGIVGQLLPIEIQNALYEFGAIQYELPALADFPGEHFTVVAARGAARRRVGFGQGLRVGRCDAVVAGTAEARRDREVRHTARGHQPSRRWSRRFRRGNRDRRADAACGDDQQAGSTGDRRARCP